MKNNSTKAPKGFVYYYNWARILDDLPADLRHAVDDAIRAYLLRDEMPGKTTPCYGIFAMIRDTLDSDRDRYAEKCERNAENVRKRWDKEQSNQAKVYDRMPSNTNVYDRMPSNTNVCNINTNTKTNTNTNTNPPYIPPTKEDSNLEGVGAKYAFEDFFSEKNAESVKAFCLTEGMSLEECRTYAKATINEWGLSNEGDTSVRHLMNTIRIKSREAKKQKAENSNFDKFSNRRGADSKARCPEDYTDQI